ncbi:hypothetical protein C8J56DRAFT_822328, partial [Mycena floridula]
MEAIGLAASIFSLVQAINPISEYVKDVQNAPTQRAEIVVNVAALKALLGVLETQVNAANSTTPSPWFTAIRGLTAPLDELRALLEKLAKKLQDPKNTAQKVKQRLTWTLDKTDVKELLSKVERVKALVTLAIQRDHISLSLAIKDDIQGVSHGVSVVSGKVTLVDQKVDSVSIKVAGVSDGVFGVSGKINDVSLKIDDVSQQIEPIAAGIQQVHGHTINAEVRDFSHWLSSVNFQATQDSFFSKCTRGTGTWFLEDPKFREWTVGDTGRFLWCQGGPGVGKTILASLVVQHVRKMYPDRGVACVFCDYKQQSTLTAAELIASILRQIMLDRPAIPKSMKELHEDFIGGYTRTSDLNRLTDALDAHLRLYPHFYLIVDALDECTDSENTRDKFIFAIRLLAKRDHVHILITSRDILDLSLRFVNEPCITIQAHESDLRTYITNRIETENRLTRLIKSDTNLKNYIVEQVIDKAAGMFLLARLHVDSLASQLSLKALSAAIATLPKEIHSSYNDTMLRVREQSKLESDLAFRVFLWLTYTKALLTVGQLEHALAVTADMNEMEVAAIVDVDILTSLCAGLVIVEDQKSDSIVRLVHYTTQEYFQGQGTDLFPDAHVVMSTTCLTYLSFDTFGQHSYDRKVEAQRFPLAQYAAEYWGEHAQECEEILCTTHAGLILEFLQTDLKVACTAYHAFNERGTYNAVHVLARFGLPRLMAMLLDNGAALDLPDSNRCTPLFHAVFYNHLPIVKLLVERATWMNDLSSQQFILDPNCMVNEHRLLYGGEVRTPLHYAVQHKSIQIIQLLLQLPGLDPNIADFYNSKGGGRTPLSYLAESGPAEMVNLLLQCPKVDPNTLSPRGRTPLSYAAEAGNLEVVVLLLRHQSIQPDLRNRGLISTPLAYAADKGHLEIVEKLIQRADVDVNAAEVDGETPLSQAADRDHHKIIQALLRHPKIKPDLGDNQGMTPLMHAAQAG